MHASSPTRKPLAFRPFALCLAALLALAASAVSYASGPNRLNFQQSAPHYRQPAPHYQQPPRVIVPAPRPYPGTVRVYPGTPVLRGPMPGQPGVIVPAPAPGYYRAPAVQTPMAPVVRNPHGDHLAEWMDKHRNLSPTQQQQALAAEPGFRDLPPQTQQREMQRLAQLNAMNPQQRQRIIDQNEYVERMSPDQRVQFRGAMQQLGTLPPDQRRVVAGAFRQLRNLPPDQRMSAAGRLPINDAQRSTLYNLIRIEPMLPPPEQPLR